MSDHIDISSVNHWKGKYHRKPNGYHALNLNVHIWRFHVTIKREKIQIKREIELSSNFLTLSVNEFQQDGQL